MTGWGKSAWASTDPATLMLQFFSDGTFQITGYIHSYCQIKERGVGGVAVELNGKDGCNREGLCPFFSYLFPFANCFLTFACLIEAGFL